MTEHPLLAQAEYDSLVRKLELTTQKSNTPKMTHGSVEIPFGSGGMNGQEVVLVNGAPKLLSEIEQFDIDSMTEEEYLSYTKTIEADIEQTDSFSFL